MMDSVLQVLRDQAEELVRGTLEEFRQQVQALVQDAEDRLKQRTEQSYDDVEASVNTLRRDMAEQLTHRQDEIVESSKEALHARVEEMLAAMLTSQNKPPKSPSSS
jgi:vacuolar-type H+-ATPase subunit E/Vma4